MSNDTNSRADFAPGDAAPPIALVEGCPTTAIWDLHRHPHVLITGTGEKSEALSLIRNEVNRHGIGSFHIDPTAAPWSDVSVPDLQQAFTTQAEIATAIEHLYDLMKRRFIQLKHENQNTFEPIVVLIDELPTVLGQNRTKVLDPLTRLVKLGRQANINLCLAADHFEDVPTQIRDSIQLKIRLGRNTWWVMPLIDSLTLG